MIKTANNPRRQRGVVLIITLLAIVLMVALILFVLNLGQQVNRRIQIQDTADASAIAGATWVARTLNSVAHNNVSTARYISLVAVLDAMPLSTEFALIEQTALHQALQAQLQRGYTSGSTSLANKLKEVLEAYEQELAGEIDQLQTVDGLFDDFDITEVTYYQSPSGRGQLWQAMTAMDEVSQTLMENLGSLAQRGAVDAVETQPDLHNAAGFMLPLTPSIPYQRGQFNDYQRPVRNGILPPDIDDLAERRGPFDAVFGWRDLIDQRVGANWVPGNSQTVGGGRGSVPIGRGAGNSGGHWEGGEIQVSEYVVWGTHSHHLRRLGDFVYNHLRNTRLGWWANTMSRAKLDYLWPPEDDPPVANEEEPQLAQTVRPEWIIDYNTALATAAAEPERIVNTAFFAVEIKSRYPRGHALFLSDGSWSLVEENDIRQPRLVRLGGWHDPRQWESAPSVTQVVQHGWRDEWEYEVWFDYEVGIQPLVDDTGQPVSQTVYRIDHFYFAGINVGDEQGIADPFVGFDPNSAQAPAPMNLDYRRVSRSDESRERYLTYLGVARRGDQAQAWPSRFNGNKPYPNSVALAQVRVFNNHSFDLWTQMWHAKLEPVGRYDAWLTEASATVGSDSAVNSADLSELESYLIATSDLARVFLEH